MQETFTNHRYPSNFLEYRLAEESIVSIVDMYNTLLLDKNKDTSIQKIILYFFKIPLEP